MYYQAIVVLFVLTTCVSEATIVCPPEKAILPCQCQELIARETIYLECYSTNLNDTRMGEIIDAFLSNPDVSPITLLSLGNNSLTRVPDRLPLMSELEHVSLANNKIRSISAGTFNFTRTLQYIGLNDNQLVYIEPGAFLGIYSTNFIMNHLLFFLNAGNYGKSQIQLGTNNLNRFESGVYQSVLEQIEPFCGSPICNALVVITDSKLRNGNLWVSFEVNYRFAADPIDCESDPCHLTWLVRDNRHLLNPIADGRCSNGTRFDDLDPNTICPVCYLI